MHRIHRNLMHELRHRSPAAPDDESLTPAGFNPTHDLEETELPLDSLELREAIVGDGVVLNEAPDGELLLHAVQAGRARRLGRFEGAASAWRAVDELDDPQIAERTRPRYARAARAAARVA